MPSPNETVVNPPWLIASPIRAICEEAFRTFHHGLKLLARDAGPRRFTITREVVANPEKAVSDWVLQQFRNESAGAS